MAAKQTIEEAGAEKAPALRGSPVEPWLTVTGVGKSYGNRPVLRDISLTVNPGEVIGLLGPNGAGKTTCFYIITGLIAPDTGRIEMSGRDVTHLPMYRRASLGIGYLPQ
ncbi:MAG: ATP-binding cassette domain-containing protein, partial [Sphingomonadales bacterium]